MDLRANREAGADAGYTSLSGGGSDDGEETFESPLNRCLHHWVWRHKGVFLATFLGSSGDAVAGSVYVLQHFKPFITHRTALLVSTVPLSVAFMYVLFKIDEVFIARAKILADDSSDDILKNTQEHPYKRQAIHILHPIVYTLGGLMACQAIGLGVMATTVIAMSNFTLQLVKSCQTYDEWEKAWAKDKNRAQNVRHTLQSTWVLNGVFLNVVRIFGVTELVVALWPMTELYIHAGGVLSFLTEAVSAIYFAIHDVHSGIIDHTHYWLVALFASYVLGSSQSTFTRPYDVHDKYKPMLAGFNDEYAQGFCCMAWMQKVMESFCKNFANNPITGRLFDCIWITCVKHVLLGPRVLLLIDSILKLITGLAMGGVGGVELFQILAGKDATLAECRYEEIVLMVFLCLAYGYANWVQVGAKKQSAKNELAELAKEDSFWARPCCYKTLTADHLKAEKSSQAQGPLTEGLLSEEGFKAVFLSREESSGASLEPYFPRDPLYSHYNAAVLAWYLALGFVGYGIGAAVRQDWDWPVRMLPMASKIEDLSTAGTVLTGVATSGLMANGLYAFNKAFNVMCGARRARAGLVMWSQVSRSSNDSSDVRMQVSAQGERSR